MGGLQPRRLARVSVVLAAIVAVLSLLSANSSAQLIFRTPTPSPTPSPRPTLTPPPATPPPPATATPEPSALPTIPGTTASPGPDESADPDGKTKDGKLKDTTDKVDDELPESLKEELVVPVFPRTRPRNTTTLVGLLRPLTDEGLPLEQVLVEGMGRFPVAGLAHYFDDWLNPRFTPKPHLHKGLDIFADFGTPIRSPERGYVSELPTGPAGGIGVWIRGVDGVSYYFAHLLERAEGLRVGQRVDVGTVIGYVGDSGNAKGGTPHLHFQIHPGGGAPVPPKPSVDAWLDEAEQLAPKWVEAKKQELNARGRRAGRRAVSVEKKEQIETSMLLTLLDPVGGSVGMMPSLELRPRRGGVISDRLLEELIAQRVEGRLFIPSSHRHVGD